MKKNNETHKIVIVLPAYNAAKTLTRTLDEIPQPYHENIILVDDASEDDTVKMAKEADLIVFEHTTNQGYGGNQKTCYREALNIGGEIMVMIHPDHQYDASAISELIGPIIDGQADAVFGSRMLGGKPMEGGMPRWKYIANVFLTAFANIIFGRYLTEIHSGLRAYSRKYLETVRFEDNNDGFVFDTEMIAQGMACNLVFKEIPIVTRYFPEASMINLPSSIKYGFGILFILTKYFLHNTGLLKIDAFTPKNNELE